MNFLKPLFFAKYRAEEAHSYDSSWVDLSTEREFGHFSILAKPAENARAVIVLAHPMIKSGKHFFKEYGHIAFYEKLGYHIVMFDFNGFGESEDNGFLFPNDVSAAIDIAKQAFPGLPIGLHGISFGGSQIILTAIEREKELSGMIIESAVSSNLDYYKGRAKNLYHVLNLYNALFPKKNEHNLYYNQIQKIKDLPLLFVYGTEDVKTPLWMGESLFNNAKTANKHLEVFDTEHLTTLKESPERYKKTVREFWSSIF